MSSTASFMVDGVSKAARRAIETATRLQPSRNFGKSLKPIGQHQLAAHCRAPQVTQVLGVLGAPQLVDRPDSEIGFRDLVPSVRGSSQVDVEETRSSHQQEHNMKHPSLRGQSADLANCTYRYAVSDSRLCSVIESATTKSWTPFNRNNPTDALKGLKSQNGQLEDLERQQKDKIGNLIKQIEAAQQEISLHKAQLFSMQKGMSQLKDDSRPCSIRTQISIRSIKCQRVRNHHRSKKLSRTQSHAGTSKLQHDQTDDQTGSYIAPVRPGCKVNVSSIRKYAKTVRSNTFRGPVPLGVRVLNQILDVLVHAFVGQRRRNQCQDEGRVMTRTAT